MSGVNYSGDQKFITKPDLKVERILKTVAIDCPLLLHNNKFPEDELYFSAKVKVGGSTQPIWFEEQQCYIYLVHTKIYNERTYNHFAVKLDKELKKFIHSIQILIG